VAFDKKEPTTLPSCWPLVTKMKPTQQVQPEGFPQINVLQGLLGEDKRDFLTVQGDFDNSIDT